MAAYDRSAKSELRRLLNALELQLLVSGIDHFQNATFAEDVSTVTDATGVNSMLSTSPVGLTTCLASPWNLETSGLRVILTDGVPSAGGTQGKSCSCAGTDPTNVNCIARAMLRFAQQGNGIWVIGVKATFAGKYYPELSPRVPFSTSQAVRRPIYIWLGGPNAQQGRRIVAGTVEAMASQGLKDVIAFEVWPGKWSGIREAQLTSGSVALNEPGAASRCGSERSRAQLASIRDHTLVLKQPEGANQILFPARVPTQTIADILPASILPLVQVSMNDTIEVTGARTLWLTEDHKGGCFELTPGNAADWKIQATIRPEPPRLQDWSTNDDGAAVNLDRTLFLSELWDTTARLLASPLNQIHVPLLRTELQ
jgi:hypothetical protein